MVSYSLGAFAAGRGRPRRVPETTSGLGAREGDHERRAGMGGKQTFTPPPPSCADDVLTNNPLFSPHPLLGTLLPSLFLLFAPFTPYCVALLIPGCGCGLSLVFRTDGVWFGLGSLERAYTTIPDTGQNRALCCCEATRSNSTRTLRRCICTGASSVGQSQSHHYHHSSSVQKKVRRDRVGPFVNGASGGKRKRAHR